MWEKSSLGYARMSKWYIWPPCRNCYTRLKNKNTLLQGWVQLHFAIITITSASDFQLQLQLHYLQSQLHSSGWKVWKRFDSSANKCILFQSIHVNLILQYFLDLIMLTYNENLHFYSFDMFAYSGQGTLVWRVIPKSEFPYTAQCISI